MLDKTFKIVTIVFCCIWVAKTLLAPGIVALFTYKSYMDHVVSCDLAMNSSWYIRQLDNEQLNKSEIIQMLDCHEYDKLRKIMLISGIPENFLSYLGLKALELHQREAEEFVKMHRFRER